MHKAESSSASNRCTRLIAFIAHKRSVSKNLPPLSGFRLTPLVLSHKPGYPRNNPRFDSVTSRTVLLARSLALRVLFEW
jgi:hypothetical protein